MHLRVVDFIAELSMPGNVAPSVLDEIGPFIDTTGREPRDVAARIEIERTLEGAESVFGDLRESESVLAGLATPHIAWSLDPARGDGRVYVSEGYNPVEAAFVACNVILLTLEITLARHFPVAAFHAAAAQTSRGAIVTPSASGGGKSSLSMMLALQGSRYLGDETALIIERDDGFSLFPFFRQLRIAPALLKSFPSWKERLSRAPVECFGQVVVQPDVPHGTVDAPIPLTGIVFVDIMDTKGVSLERLSADKAFVPLLDALQAMPAESMGKAGKADIAAFNRQAFVMLQRLAAGVPVWKARYRFPEDLGELARKIEEQS